MRRLVDVSVIRLDLTGPGQPLSTCSVVAVIVTLSHAFVVVPFPTAFPSRPASVLVAVAFLVIASFVLRPPVSTWPCASAVAADVGARSSRRAVVTQHGGRP